MPGRELRPFHLPGLVEARKVEESEMFTGSPISTTGHAQHLSGSSTISDLPSPTFSLRGHSRLPSSTSSLASSPAVRESMDGFGTVNRPLTDVKEEPQDRVEDYEMVNDPVGHRAREGKHVHSCDYHHTQPDSRIEEILSKTPDNLWALYQPTARDLSSAYDLEDDVLDGDFAPNPCAKRQRAEDFPLSPMDGIKSRMPSILRSPSRKWRSRKVTPTTAISDRSQEPSRSRANSTRAPSIAGSIAEMGDTKGLQLPPTPTRTAFDDSLEDAYLSIDTHKANSMDHEVVDREAKPTTPLLPPILTQIPAHIREVPYQSPLQSPSVAEPEVPSAFNSPLPTPRIAGLPSPPLSSKPSIASFHHQRGMPTISPSSEIPPMLITDPNDHWADQLGHANYTIEPQPYVPEETTMAACKDVRANWEMARYNYQKHIARTGEHYGTSSKVFRLTEQKWAEVDANWKRNLELTWSCIQVEPLVESATTSSSHDSGMSMSDIAPQPTPIIAPMPAPLMKMPSLNGPKSEGKFPTLGDDGIVGPMEQLPSIAQQPQRRKRKLGFFKWMQGVWPTGNVLSRRTSAGS